MSYDKKPFTWVDHRQLRRVLWYESLFLSLIPAPTGYVEPNYTVILLAGYIEYGTPARWSRQVEFVSRIGWLWINLPTD